MLSQRDEKIMSRPQLESGYLNTKVNSMKSTILAATILLSLAGPISVLAEAPAVTVKPFAAKVLPIDDESTAQQVVAETPAEAEAPVTELHEQQTAAPAGEPAEPQQVSAALAEAAVPANEIVEEQTATPLEEVDAGASAPGMVTPSQPCPRQGMGMMRKGMGHGCHTPGGRKPCCDRRGGRQQDKHEQVVRRLDMIDARIAKIEAMLESLMQR